MDEFQWIRMFLIWPLVVSALAWWLAFLLLERITPHHRNELGALVLASAAGLMAANISRSWSGGFYWLAFTLGLAGAALVLWSSVAWVALRHARA